MVRKLVIALVWFAALPALAGSATARGLASTLVALQSVPLAEDEVTVPLAARIWLADAKGAVRELAEEILDDGVDGPSCVQERLDRELAGATVSLESRDSPYGGIAIEVTAPQGRRDLIAVELSLGIPYDTDSMLLLFRHDGARWRTVFDREENDYPSIGDALGSFQWKISPPDEEGAFLILTTAISPSPASSWQRLTYTVDRIVPWSDAARAIDHRECSIYLNDDLETHVSPHGYGLRFSAENIEPGFTQTRVLEYRLDGEEAVRIEPIAELPQAFVQEWLSLPEGEAMRWSDVPRIDPGEGYQSWGPIRQCADGLWQVRLDLTDLESDEYQSAYFIVEGENERFRLREIRDEPRPGCPDEFAEPETTTP
jgi:hypothetical protein